MRKRQIKLTITQITTDTATPTKIIKISSNNPYFFKTLSIEHLELPPSILQKYEIEITLDHILFQNKKDNKETITEIEIEKIKKYFHGIYEWIISEDDIEGKEENLIKELNKEKHKYILGYKKFNSQEAHYDQGDYIFFSKISINKLINLINNFSTQNDLLFSLDEHLQNKSLLNFENMTNIIITENYAKIREKCHELDLAIDKIEPKIEPKEKRNKKIPSFSISLSLSGKMKNIHKLYEEINKQINNFLSKIIEITDERFVPERLNKIEAIFKETIYDKKVFKISTKTILLLEKSLDSENLRNKLKSKIWILDHDQFTNEEIHILISEHKTNSLNLYMKLKKVDYDFIKFENHKLLLACDEYTRDKFIRECAILLKNYVKEREYCRTFDNSLIIKIFRKYYLQIFENKFGVVFEIGENYLIRNNFTKYSGEIQEELRIVREKIHQNIVTFVSRQPIKNSTSITTLFQQIVKPHGYDHEFLGCKIYLYRDIKIKLKPIESLQRQEPSMAYILDDRLHSDSIFYDIIKQNKVNFNAFLADAHRAKKPERLRQYITEHCHFSHQTCILHAGKEKVTQTLKRDLECLFSLLKNNICLTIMRHEESYYHDVFKVVLGELAAYAAKIVEDVAGLVNPSKTEDIYIPKEIHETSIYYEGGRWGLQRIENIFNRLSITKMAEFYLEKLDIEKIYALEYIEMEIKTNQKSNIKLSPIISELLYYEFPHFNQISKITNTRTQKRFIFSCFLPSIKQKHEQETLIEYILCTKTKFIYKVTHINKNGTFSKIPKIEKIQETIGELNTIMKVIRQYFKSSEFTVISSKIISNGIFEKTEFAKNYYIATEGTLELSEAIINLKEQKILKTETEETYELTFKENPLKEWYEIITYGEELNDILSLIS